MLTRLLLIVSTLMILPTGSLLWAQPYIDMGASDGVALDQPRVAVRVWSEPDTILGPDISNTWLLDSAAQGLLAAGTSVGELETNGYRTEAVYEEIGIGGTSLYDVSAIYQFDFAGTDGQPRTLNDVRLLSDADKQFGSFGGIVGSPGMLNRVCSLDLSPMREGSYMGVAFSETALPAGTGHRYTAEMTLQDFPPTGQQNPDDPLPSYGPLMFADVELQQGAAATTSPFVIDTGAQQSLVSTTAAIALGFDSDADGSLDDEGLPTTTLSGVSGSVSVPVITLERLALPVLSETGQELDFVWSNLSLPVYDIDPSIGGIFGCELLTQGWIDVFLGTGSGAFEEVHFDLLDTDNAALVFDVSERYDVIVPEPASLAVMGAALAGLVQRRQRRRRSFSQ